MQQISSKIHYRADILRNVRGAKNKENYRLLEHNVHLSHQGRIMRCDSARFYSSREYVEAYGSVHVEDSLYNIYSERLDYDGTRGYAYFRSRVRYEEARITFEGDSMDYDMSAERGWFWGGGEVWNKAFFLYGDRGYYDVDDSISIFRGNVQGYFERYRLRTDTLYYRSLPQGGTWADMIGKTTLWLSDSSWVSAAKGGKWFSMSSSSPESKIEGYAACYYTPHYTLCADTLFFVRPAGRQEARGHVRIRFVRSSVSEAQGQDIIWAWGDYMRYFPEQKEAILYSRGFEGQQKPPLVRRLLPNRGIRADSVAKKAEEGSFLFAQDTLYIQADTLWLRWADTLGEGAIFRGFLAQGAARSLQNDVATFSERLMYATSDSILHFSGEPVWWKGETQLSADSMRAKWRGEVLEVLFLRGKALLVTHDTLDRYNQIGGRTMQAWFSGSEMDSMWVSGNGESIYYAYEKDSIFSGMNRTISGKMRIYFHQNDLEQVVFALNPEGKFYPPSLITREVKTLAYFSWKRKEKLSHGVLQRDYPEVFSLFRPIFSWEEAKKRLPLLMPRGGYGKKESFLHTP